MAGNATDYLEDALRDHVLLDIPYTAPSTLYLGVFSVAPDDSDPGTEAVDGSYARQAIVFEAGASPGQATNADDIDFVNMPAGTWEALGIFDAATDGNLLIWAIPAVPKTTAAGQTLSYAAGDLDAAFL